LDCERIKEMGRHTRTHGERKRHRHLFFSFFSFFSFAVRIGVGIAVILRPSLSYFSYPILEKATVI